MMVMWFLDWSVAAFVVAAAVVVAAAEEVKPS